jgi:NAD(P)-dependent dehydrogenase (short-subunit alcohol dehydrogenase family)
MFRLDGKAAFVTGGAAGIGLAVTERLIAAGARVAIGDIIDAAAVAAKVGAVFVHCDVSREESVRCAMRDAAARLGHLDIVINNAGVGDVGPTLMETDQSLLEKLTRINQWGVLYGLKYAPVYMTDHGSIINTSSAAAVINMVGSGVYSSGKAAVVSMTRMAALELGARGIRVNAVCPGYVATGMGSGEEGLELARAFTALGRGATVDDLVGTFHFLAADESRYLTGQAIVVDGGWSCGPTTQLLERVLGRSHVS